MTIEINFGERKKLSTTERPDEPSDQEFDSTVQELQSSLVFPPPSKNPILNLARTDGDAEKDEDELI